MDNKPSKQKIAMQGEQAFKRMMDYQYNNGWKKYDSKPCDMYTMKMEGRIASKGQTIIKYNIQQVFKYLGHPKTIKLINPQVNLVKVIDMIQQGLRIQTQGYDGIWPASGRDFIMVTSFHRKQNKIYISSKSINYPLAEVEGVVRGQVYMGGYILQKISDTQTQVTYFSDVDVKGLIPGFIKNQVAKRQGSLAGNIEKQMKKSYKK